MTSAYVSLGGGRFRSTELTRGPWDPGHQHAGPPVALAARAIEQEAAKLGMVHVARVTASLFRPIPIAELEVDLRTEYAGRNSAHFSARLISGSKEVVRLSALAQREAPFAVPGNTPGHPLPRAPRAVEESPAERIPFDKPGYADFVETRVAEGVFFKGPSAVWFRMRHPLVEGEAPSPLQRVLVAADSGNGISAALDFRRYIFVNSDLTVNLLRPAQGEWICVDARSLVGPAGGGLAEARLFDAAGLIGRSTQSLAIRMRE